MNVTLTPESEAILEKMMVSCVCTNTSEARQSISLGLSKVKGFISVDMLRAPINCSEG